MGVTLPTATSLRCIVLQRKGFHSALLAVQPNKAALQPQTSRQQLACSNHSWFTWQASGVLKFAVERAEAVGGACPSEQADKHSRQSSLSQEANMCDLILPDQVFQA